MPRASSLARAGAAALLLATAGAQAAECTRPVYLTFDTGHMGVAPLVAEVLDRQQVKASFFLANEKTRDGGTSLDDHWAPWWKAMAARGHVFGSHTYDHVYWLADRPDGAFRAKPAFGPQAGRVQAMSAEAYCAELDRSAARFKEMTGQTMLPLFRAPGGKTSPALLQAAENRCGYRHVGWADAGFLGDELPSDKYPNAALLARALRNIRPGDILMAHLGIWSRQDPWAPAVLEPLITGLKQKGYCFATLADHPQYRAWLATHHVHGNP
ncbi:polysaccharide deacetylase family protein [Pigmentiphaga sp. H8]|uniref:polysaccharide deacetylase family protein n=1 Tax=unclassified Pigmentiphaga TaxID=2626614 RepID=UPI000F5A05C1|nr:polysaccharide deacetylase family protein [Pigmentiphaga sp. H8]AZG08758.1 polysaccharide deacetylase family protein [Pigmentiphaga sp. H8]